MQYDLPAKEHPHFSKKGMLEFHLVGILSSGEKIQDPKRRDRGVRPSPRRDAEESFIRYR
jgi:hypothetical protein